MPIARFEVRNEYGLGQRDLYLNVDREDPKAVLDGVAVAGIVGILRQLGDLAEFAAEIFHGIQEEVMNTSSRSNKLMIRLKHIEATIPSLEKTMLAQTSHIHFAYTAGREWHPRIQNDQSHFICDDLPRFIMDSYEECRDPPRLHLLDKFDIDGPGSCLKRYSDPTYFRRASGKSIEVNNDFPKDNKNRKITKKKSLQRNRDLSRLAAVTKQSGRKPFMSLSFSGRSSSSKTSSTIDTELKSNLQDHYSRSFDSRSGSGYIERLSVASSSVKAEEKPPGFFSSSSLTPGALTIASVLSECHSEDADDTFSYSPSHEQTGRGCSSCISWDEKAEIMQSNGVQCVTIEAPEKETNGIVDAPGGRKTAIESDHDIKAGREIGSKLEMGSEEETESDGETFVDALNTIESESDNDYGLQISKDLQKNSNERLESSRCEHDFAQPCPTEREMEQNSNNGEFKGHCLGYDSTDVQASKSNSSGLETFLSANAFDELISQDSRVALENQSLPSDLSAGMDVKPPPVLASGDSLSNRLCNNGMEEHKEAEAYHNAQPVTIWTNGTLLGLQPSKPPVFVAAPKTEDVEKENSDIVLGNPPPFTSDKASHDKKPDDPERIHADGSADCAGYQRESQEALSGVLGLSHRLLVNGFRSKESFGRDKKIVPATIPENAEVTEKNNGFISQDVEDKTVKEPFKNDIPFDWLTSSPPLEHMKISFNPIESLQISKLKLRFPDGCQHNESKDYTFSSFQLVPEPVTSVPDFDSDDDTFCRSSPCMSGNDYPSDKDSVSSSKQWEESSDSSERKDQKLYDSLLRKSEAEPSLSAPLLSVPNSSVSENLSYLQSPAEPLPPPLPPVQWRVSKQSTERFEDEPQSLQDELKRVLDKKKSYLSTGSHCTNSVNKEQSSVDSDVPKPENNVHQKNNGKEDKRNVNVKETETEDFLHQIRTKQFNLRRVISTKPSSAAARGPVPNNSINAILEKANSIRQAVASEDGDESDTWSDT